MNNPNPFVPKGSLLEQQSMRRSRLKIAVGCAVAVSVTGLVVMLIQGCKRDQPQDNPVPPADTNSSAMTSSNPPPDLSSNAVVYTPSNPAPAVAPAPVPSTPMPLATPTPTPTPAVTEPVAGAEYVVAPGDTLAKIAKANGVTLKALKAANPGVDPKKLKVKQKLTIPGKAADATTGGSAVAAAAPEVGAAAGTGAAYTVKSGDTLTKIAKRNGVSVKALRAANGLTTDHLKVGQKLTIPAKAEAAAAAPAPATPDASATPMSVPTPAPTVPTPAPTTGH